MKLPGPDHPITIAANPKRVRVSAGSRCGNVCIELGFN